jgi:hypothetical protein
MRAYVVEENDMTVPRAKTLLYIVFLEIGGAEKPLVGIYILKNEPKYQQTKHGQETNKK